MRGRFCRRWLSGNSVCLGRGQRLVQPFGKGSVSGDRANPIDACRTLRYRLVILLWAVMLILLWLGPRKGPDHPVYGLLSVSWTFFLGPALGDAVMRLPARWFHVPQGERVLQRMLGVGLFGGPLERSGDNRRFVHPS